MSGEILNRRDGVTLAGFFGKLPSTGDFVSRGLPDGFRRQWDAWVTRHLAPLQRDGARWPPGGLRFRLTSGGRAAGGVIVPGADSAGRSFPLSLVLIGADLPGPEALDRWCDGACAAAEKAGDPDLLWHALDDLPVPPRQTPAEQADFMLWIRGRPPVPADPASPAGSLHPFFGPLSSG